MSDSRILRPGWFGSRWTSSSPGHTRDPGREAGDDHDPHRHRRRRRPREQWPRLKPRAPPTSRRQHLP